MNHSRKPVVLCVDRLRKLIRARHVKECRSAWASLALWAILVHPSVVIATDFASDLVADQRVQAVTELVFTEGPAYHADGSVYFSDLPSNRIMRWVRGADRAHVFLQPSGRANGLLFDRQGGLLACEGNEHGGLGGRRLVRIDLRTKRRTLIADKFQGKRFNSPNDLCIDNQGRIYFTDPYYGPLRNELEMDVEAIYRVDPDGKNLIRVLGKNQVKQPNGIAISADSRLLFVVDTHIGAQKLYAFPLDDDGFPTGKRREFYDFGKGRGGDGMCIDVNDNIYVAAGADRYYPNQNLDNPAGVYVFSRQGTSLGLIPVPEDMVANCCFGDPDLKTLYVTAGKTLWRIRVKISGRVAWPQLVRNAN